MMQPHPPMQTTQAIPESTHPRRNGHNKWPHVDLVALIRESGCTVRQKAPDKWVSDHSPKHASRSNECLVIWPQKGWWYCSSCGKSGDAAGWIMHLEGCDYHEAARRLAERFGPAPARDGPGDGRPASQASRLVRLALATYDVFASPDGEPMAVARPGPPVALPLRGERGLRAALAHRFAEEAGRVPTAAALTDVLSVLEGRALTAPRREPALRLARWQDPTTGEAAIVLDLGRADGLAVVIRPGRWEVTPTPDGIIWRRTRLTGELPVPERGPGDARARLDGLRTLLNLTDAAWDLFVGSLVAGFFPDIPHPIELLRGPEGSGKSTAARLRVQLTDPSPVPLRSPPKSLDDWQVAAAGSWVVAVDNLSAVPDWLSDAFCRASTGDGLVKRELYTSQGLSVLAFRRLVVLTTIDAGALRGDLADRLVWFELARIPDDARQPEAAIIAAFERGHARWLGAVCDLAAAVLAVLPDVRLPAYPRMADYARVLAAVDQVASTQALAAYRAQRGELAREVVAADAVAAAVQEFLDDRGGATWTGTASELYAALTPERPPRGWPADATRLSGRLRRAEEPLRRIGITVTFSASHRAGRLITLTRTPVARHETQETRVPAAASPASPASPAGSRRPGSGDAAPLGGDARGDAAAAVGDAGDAAFPTLSLDAIEGERCAVPGCEATIDVYAPGGRGFCEQHLPPPPAPGPGHRTDEPDVREELPANPANPAPEPGHPGGAASANAGTWASFVTTSPARPPVALLDDADAVRALLPELVRQPVLGLDTETEGLDPRTCRLRLVQLATPERVDVIDLFRVPPAALTPLFANPRRGPVLVGHNAKFDLRFLWAAGLVPPHGARLFDTMLADQLVRGGQPPRSLKDLAAELGLPLDKAFQDADWSGELSPAMLQYAAQDAAVLLPLERHLRERLKALDLERVAELEFRALPAVAWLEQTGCPFDFGAWEALAEQAQAERDRLAAALSELATATMQATAMINWDSAPQVLAALRAAGLDVPDTREETLAAHADHPLVALLLRYREAAKRAGTYGRDWLRYASPADGRVHADWHQIGAASGRMACRNPNLQNLPRDGRYRACIRPGAGWVLVKADYSQIELRIAAELAGERRMLDAFRRGDDLHRLTAALVLGKPPDAVTADDRQLAKAVNFGLLYGMGPGAFAAHARTAYGVALSEAQAAALREKFFAAYPGLRRWHRAQPRGAMTTRTLTGRKRFGVERFTEKLNTPVQGSGADGLKLALAELWETREWCPQARPILCVHDEVVVECPAEQAESAGSGCRTACSGGWRRCCGRRRWRWRPGWCGSTAAPRSVVSVVRTMRRHRDD